MSLRCDTCWRHCALKEGQVGACRARGAIGGRVVPLGYGQATSLALDPVEKKPLARWRPGTFVVSVGSFGCNLRCPWCQNHEISQVGKDEVGVRELEPAELVALTVDARARDARVVGVAYTYNEPLVAWEYVRDASVLAREAGLGNVLVSAGCVEPHVAHAVAPWMDAANIDVKTWSAATYRRIGGDLDAVRSCVETLVEAGCHVEVTTLVVPGVNDDAAEIAGIASWLASLDPTICYHLTRFFGRYRMAGAAPTPRETLMRLAGVAREHLADVVLGNV